MVLQNCAEERQHPRSAAGAEGQQHTERVSYILGLVILDVVFVGGADGVAAVMAPFVVHADRDGLQDRTETGGGDG